MRFIIEETLIPWLPSGSSTAYFVADNFDEMWEAIEILTKRAKERFHFTDEDIEDLSMWEDKEQEGYIETYLDKDEPYQSWSVAWRVECEIN